jgi:hypothetical protein
MDCTVEIIDINENNTVYISVYVHLFLFINKIMVIMIICYQLKKRKIMYF